MENAVDVSETFVRTTKSERQCERHTSNYIILGRVRSSLCDSGFSSNLADPPTPCKSRPSDHAVRRGGLYSDLVALRIRGPPTFRGIFAERFERRDSRHCPTKLCVAGDPRFREVERACRAVTRMEEFRGVRISPGSRGSIVHRLDIFVPA